MTSIVKPAEVFPPGEYLRDELDERGWTAKEFAEIIGRPVQVISEILNGRKQIMPETALALGEALGTSAELWTNLQTRFNLQEARSNRTSTNEVLRRSLLRSRVPVTELRQRGWLPDTDDLDVLESAVKDLLGTSSMNDEPKFAAAARRSDPNTTFSIQQIAWLSRLRQLASGRNVPTFNASAVKELAGDLVHRIIHPDDLRDLDKWLGDVGIVLVTLRPLKSSKLDGATMMLESGTPVIGLTSRGDRMDIYVFTLLHELAHVCLGHLDSGSIRIDEEIAAGTDKDDLESAADQQAADWILPPNLELPAGRPSAGEVLQIAQRYRVHPSFVIGRIQHERGDFRLLRGSIPRVLSSISAES